MLKLALAFELRQLLRSPSSILAVIAFLAIGALAILVGQKTVTQWESAIDAASAAQAEAVAEAREYLAAGEQGPADRPWIDLSQPRWQDWYSGTRVARQPGPLAAVAAGTADSAPVVFRVSRLADPISPGGYRIENPEVTDGTIDLVLVLSLLLPLLIASLGLDIGSRERESGLDRLIAVQAGTVNRWLASRTLAATLITGLTAVLLCLVASLSGGADAYTTAAFILLALLYSSLWGGLLLIVASRARNVRNAAFAFGGLWTLLCVLIPSLSAEIAIDRVVTDYAASETLEAREVRYAAHEEDLSDVLPMVYDAYPELTRAPAAADKPLDPMVARYALDVGIFDSIKERHTARESQERQAVSLAERAAFFSPTVAIALALERLAGVGPEAASSYRNHLLAAVDDRLRWVVDRAWQKRSLEAQDFEALIANQTPAFKAEPTGLALPTTVLLIWAVVAWLVGLKGLRRVETSV